MNERTTYFSILGSKISNEFCHAHVGTPSDAIKAMSDDRMMVCLLSTLVQNVNRMYAKMDAIEKAMTRPKPQAATPKHPVADGMHCVLGGYKLVSEMDQSSLSVRSRKLLKKLDVELLSEVTEEALMAGCGPTATREILEWKKGCV